MLTEGWLSMRSEDGNLAQVLLKGPVVIRAEVRHRQGSGRWECDVHQGQVEQEGRIPTLDGQPEGSRCGGPAYRLERMLKMAGGGRSCSLHWSPLGLAIDNHEDQPLQKLGELFPHVGWTGSSRRCEIKRGPLACRNAPGWAFLSPFLWAVLCASILPH